MDEVPPDTVWEGLLFQNVIFMSDMIPTDKKILKCVWSMALPAAMESLLVGLIELADTTMVSQLGLAAVAAVGVSSQPRRILLMFILALNVGATALISRRIGEGKLAEARLFMQQFIIRCAMLALVLYSLGFLYSRPMLLLSGANLEYIDDAVVYFRIILVGQFFQSLSLCINACLRAEGKTGIAFRTNVTANIVNVILNFLLIYGKCGFPRLEVRGAAIATVAGNLSAFLISLWSVRRKSGGILYLERDRSSWKWSKNLIPSGLNRIIFNAMWEQLFHRLGLLIYARIAAGLGTEPFALYNYIIVIGNLQVGIYDGFAVTATTLTGQHMGARDIDKAEKSVRASLWLGYASAVILAAFLFAVRAPLMSIFSSDRDIVQAGGGLLMFVAAACVPCAGSAIYAGALRGAGETRSVAIFTFLSTAFFRPICAWILCVVFSFGNTGIWFTYFASHTIRWISMRCCFSGGKWKEISF